MNFANVAMFHFLRLWLDRPPEIGGGSVPSWISRMGNLVAGGLCLQALRLPASRGER